jgi:hypothetical protein
MTRPTDPLFDQRIADWLEADPVQAPDQVLEIVLAALPSIPRRGASRVPRRLIAMPTSIRWSVAAAAVVGVLVVGGALYLSRPSQPAVGGQSPTPSANVVSTPLATPTAAPTSIVVQPRPATWTATGNLTTARTRGTATLLSDGKVLVAGGIDASGWVTSAELYDPETGSWTATGSMRTPRAGHTATLLSDGKVLVTGGINGASGSLASAELFDPATGSWTAARRMHSTRLHATATLLPGGMVLVAGGDVSDGWGEYTSSAELYDPSTGTWTTTENMTTPRGRHTATLLSDGNVLVAGGVIGVADGVIGSAVAASAELYDPSTGTWTASASMSTARMGITATLLLDGKVLVAGGLGSDNDRSAELYDPGAGSWTTTGSMDAPRGNHSATLLPNGYVLVVGGGDSNDPVVTAELYNPGTGSWFATLSVGAKRDVQSATLLRDGTVLVVSGDTGTVASGYADLYDPGTGR